MIHQSTALLPVHSLMLLEEKRAHPNVAAQKNLPEFPLPSTSANQVAIGTFGTSVRPYPKKCHGLIAQVSQLRVSLKNSPFF